MAVTSGEELVFVVDVTSFTEKGFMGSTSYGGQKLDLEFDDTGRGVQLTAGMANKLGARKGSKLVVLVEDDRPVAADVLVAGIATKVRISDPRVYYAIGKEGGAVIRIRKA